MNKVIKASLRRHYYNVYVCIKLLVPKNYQANSYQTFFTFDLFPMQHVELKTALPFHLYSIQFIEKKNR